MEVAPGMSTDLSHFPILVFNGGSSSIKFSIYMADGKQLTKLNEGEAAGIGTPRPQFNFYAFCDGKRDTLVSESEPKDLGTTRDAVRKIATLLHRPGVTQPAAIGHRIVHTGPNLHAHQQITSAVLLEIEKAASFAPLHQPIGLEIVCEAKELFPSVKDYACFDTIFDQDLPEVASIYPLPKEIRDQGVHRYGFHGLSCESIMEQLRDGSAQNLKAPNQIPKRVICAHLGSGASVTAIRDGKAMDCSMGLTPAGGVIMGTRPGDVDPGLVFYLMRLHGGTAADATTAVEQLLNKGSGLLALSGISNDMRILRDAEKNGDAQAALAIEAFALSVKKMIGGYVALMSGLDALIFSGGIGENDPKTRAQVCAGMEAFGLILDSDLNDPTHAEPKVISRADSKVVVYILPADEDRIIAEHVARLVAEE